ncbi:unannotated protein [freshwater metagenome]|uniref:Unannotated protein n=1 Tax=freshwater metagenome TaxID=449393 RepID=A0A6J7BZJ0_9ZZZZ|nr:hypothetical protein [Actinomycetota bacterium]
MARPPVVATTATTSVELVDCAAAVVGAWATAGATSAGGPAGRPAARRRGARAVVGLVSVVGPSVTRSTPVLTSGA